VSRILMGRQSWCAHKENITVQICAGIEPLPTPAYRYQKTEELEVALGPVPWDGIHVFYW
jgi:hypothetical protein